MNDYKDKIWFQFLDHSMQDLASTSYILLDMFQNPGHPEARRRIQRSDINIGGNRLDSSSQTSQNDKAQQLHDYSFIVFPLAKAYEGFLKKWLFTNHLIDENDYLSDHFRLGKALNPSIERKFRGHDYVYDKIVANCSDPHLADRLWDAWKQCRNLIFHYFPNHQHFLSTIAEAQTRLDQLDSVMSEALSVSVLE